MTDEFTTIRIRTRVLNRIDRIVRSLAFRADEERGDAKISRSRVIELAANAYDKETGFDSTTEDDSK